MRITSKGQVTIPANIREQAGLLPNTEVDFELDRKGNVTIVRAGGTSRKRICGERLIAHMRGRGDVRLTTDQIMKLTRG